MYTKGNRIFSTLYIRNYRTKGYPKTKPSSSSPPLTDHSTRLASVKVTRLNSAPPNIHNSLQTISQIKMKNEEEHRKKMKVIEVCNIDLIDIFKLIFFLNSACNSKIF